MFQPELNEIRKIVANPDLQDTAHRGYIMKTTGEFERDAQKWDDRELGASMEHTEVASMDQMKAFNDALSLQAISIRLQKKLVSDLKSIAESYGIGYQPMVRDLLQRFVIAEKKQALHKQLEQLNAQEEIHQQEDTVPVDEFIQSIRKQA